MFKYLWYRHVRFRPEFEKDNRVDEFAEYYMSANLGRMKAKGDQIRERVRSIGSNRLQWSTAKERLEAHAHLLRDDEFYSVATKYHRLAVVLALIAISESGLNYFTALIAIPAVGMLAGGFGSILRLAAAVIITVIGILGAEEFFEEVLPSQKYGEVGGAARRVNWARALLWGIVLIGIEYMIFHFGLVRIKDIEGGRVDSDIAKSIIVLSMIVPIVGGGIAWELSNIHDAYKNRQRVDRYARLIDQANTTVETLKEQENGYLQQETNDWWHTYLVLRTMKEYFNRKNGVETAPLSTEHQYARRYQEFYTEALERYNSHKEMQDPLRRLKIDSEVLGVVGRKIGQDGE